jgi:AraC-like DNA-binding protein
MMQGIWDWLLLLGRLAVLYFVGWYGMRQADVFLPPVHAAPDPDPPAAQDKYARSGMTGAASALIGERLTRRSRDERDFLDSDLKLVDLAERIGTSPQLLSEYLNDVLGLNFFDYVNGLRIAEVQRLMSDPAHASRAVQDLAFDAGFNSRSTFYTAFKKNCGMTPAEWRKQHVRMSAPLGPDSGSPSTPDTGGDQAPSRPPLSPGVS